MKKELLFLALDTDVRSFIKSARPSFVSIFSKSPRSLPLFLSIIYSRFAPFFHAIRTRWQLD